MEKKYPLTIAVNYVEGVILVKKLYVPSTSYISKWQFAQSAKMKGHKVTGDGSFYSFDQWGYHLGASNFGLSCVNTATAKYSYENYTYGAGRLRALMRSVRQFNIMNELGTKPPPKSKMLCSPPKDWLIVT